MNETEANETLVNANCRGVKVRTNYQVVCELAYERREVSDLLSKLNKAIEDNPEAVSAHHKELWRRQEKAMQEYVEVLGERIKDLIDNG